MAFWLSLLSVCALLVPYASQANSGARVMGITDGAYVGSGTLLKGPLKIRFTSTRTIADGTLIAHSTAKVLGFPINVDAHLRFVPSPDSGNVLDVLSLDDLDDAGNPEVVGSSTCVADRCTFDASIKHGRFELRETWAPRADGGFDVIDGWQRAGGLELTYTGSFSR